MRRAPRPGPVLLAGLALIGVATGFRVWAIREAWFFFDDFYFIQEALRHRLTPAYLVEPYNGHLMPASTLLSWVNARLDPWSFALPATEMMVLFALAGVGALRMLITLFGPRRAVLVPLGLFLFSPILLPATLWWAAGVNQLPMLVAIGFGLHSFARHLQEHRTVDLLLSLAWLLGGLAFVERTMIALPIFWMVALLYFTSGTVPERFVDLWHQYRTAVVAHAVLLTAYLAAYVPWAMNFDATSITERPLFGVLGNLGGIAFPTGLVGGPLSWQVSDVTQSEANPPQAVLLLGWAVVGLLVLASARTRRRGLRAWLIPAGVLLANAGLIATSRAIFFGAGIALDYRFQTEVALATALALGLAFLPVVGARESSEPVPASWAVDTRGTVAVAGAVFLALALVSTARFPLRNLTTTSPRAYLEAVQASTRDHPGSQLLNQPTPAWFWAPLAYPTNTYRYQFLPIADRLDIRSETTDAAFRVDDRGRFVPLVFSQVRQQAAASTGDCFGRLDGSSGADSGTWRLDGPVIGFGWFLRLSYDASAATTVTITLGDVETTTQLEAGRHHLLAPATGSYEAVRLTVPADAPRVCLQHLAIGTVDGAG